MGIDSRKKAFADREDLSEYGRKLGLDFNATFSFLFGVNFPRPRWYSRLSGSQKKLWHSYRHYGSLMTALLFVSSAVEVRRAYRDIRVLTTCVGTITYIVCVLIKLAIFNRHVKILRSITDCLHRISRNLDRNPLTDRGFFPTHSSRVIYVKAFGIGKNLAIASGVGTLAFFEIAAGIRSARKDRNLPMSGWFPYDPLGDVGFVVSCLFQFVSYLSFLLKDVAIDLLFMTILVSFDSFLVYLRKLLRLIATEKTGRKKENLIWWIEQHQLVLRTIEDFKIISSPYLFAKYISVAIILFFGGLLVTSDVMYDLVQQMIVLSINMSNLLQLYIFSVLGDKITENAHRAADGGFDVALLSDSREIRKIYFYSLARAKKPMLIRFGSINPLSVHSFGQIVKMCFSYFTTIVQIRGE